MRVWGSIPHSGTFLGVLIRHLLYITMRHLRAYEDNLDDEEYDGTEDNGAVQAPDFRKVEYDEMERLMRGETFVFFSPGEVNQIIHNLSASGLKGSVVEYRVKGKVGIDSFSSSGSAIAEIQSVTKESGKKETYRPTRPTDNVLVKFLERRGKGQCNNRIDILKSVDDYFYVDVVWRNQQGYYICDGVRGLLDLMGVICMGDSLFKCLLHLNARPGQVMGVPTWRYFGKKPRR